MKSKNSASYWKVENNKLNKTIDIDRNILDRLYRTKLKEINIQIEAFYKKYAIDNIITINEAKQMLSAKEFRIFNSKLKEWIKSGKYSRDKSFIASLERMVGVSRIDRLQRLEVELTASVSELKGTQLDFMYKSLEDTYKTSENSVAPFSSSFKQTSEYKIRAIINSSFSDVVGIDTPRFSNTIWKHRSKMTKSLKDVLKDGFTKSYLEGSNWNKIKNELNEGMKEDYIREHSGSNLEDIKSSLNKEMKKFDYLSRRVLVTESTRLNSIAKQRSFLDAGFQYYQYQTIGKEEKSVDMICKALHDKVFKLDEMVIGSNAPSMHPNCRCYTVPYVYD